MESLRSLALDLEIPERTLRRAAREGLVRGDRVGPHAFRTSVGERSYLRRHWALLSRLRALLRTEPNVAFAVLYGSQATGAAGPSSDIDILVSLRVDDIARLAALAGRLSDALGRDVQLVRLDDARAYPALLADVLDHGRVLVDRAGGWQALQRRSRTIRKQASTATSLEDAAAALSFRDLQR